MSDDKILRWPGEPPPPYGKDGAKAYAEWEKKAEEFCEALERAVEKSQETA